MRSERFDFTGAEGQRLAGRIDAPDHAPKAHALFAHCFTCGKDVLAASRIAQALVRHGIATLRFDFSGLGASEGDFANSHFSSNIADLVAAARGLASIGASPDLLVGHSLGGAAVLAAAREIESVKAVATIAAPFEAVHVTHLFTGAMADIEALGEAEIRVSGRAFKIRKSFIDDLKGHDQAARIARLGLPLMVLHAPTDDVVGIDNAKSIFMTARHPKSFVALPGADHLLRKREDAEYAAALIAAWASRYLGTQAG